MWRVMSSYVDKSHTRQVVLPSWDSVSISGKIVIATSMWPGWELQVFSPPSVIPGGEGQDRSGEGVGIGAAPGSRQLQIWRQTDWQMLDEQKCGDRHPGHPGSRGQHLQLPSGPTAWALSPALVPEAGSKPLEGWASWAWELPADRCGGLSGEHIESWSERGGYTVTEKKNEIAFIFSESEENK